ncbi:MAG: TSUP family transporter [Anaerolineae bacterium]
MTTLLVALIVFAAIFTQGFLGFGLALVSMPLLVMAVGLPVATPLVALVSVTAEVVLLLYYRAALNLRAVARLTLASLPGIPLGVWLLRGLDEHLVLGVLGVIVAGYALYGLAAPRLPELRNPRWALGLGFVAGMLGGAYNTPGPPVIIYGTCRRWSPPEFKGNLQAFFIVNSVLVAVSHYLAGNITAPVIRYFLVALPAIGLGALAGFALERRVASERFHRLVLVALVGLGLSLLML